MVLGALRRVFWGTGARAPIDMPENRVFDEAPTPAYSYSRIVDKNGDEIIGRQPNGGDFLARAPVHYNYGGTIPKFNPADYPTLQDKMAAAMEYAARDYRNKQNIDKAVFLLSQTNDGRRLLRKAEEQGFTFVFDHDRLEKEKAAGLCDYKNKLIPLTEGRSPFGVALTIKHELQHMEDIEKGAIYHDRCTLLSAIMGDRALEANARVSEAIAASELLLGNPDGPEQQFRSSALFAHFFHSKPAMAKVALDNLDEVKKKNWGGFALPVFKAYQRLTGTLDYYDDRLADIYSGPMQNIIDGEQAPILPAFASQPIWETKQQSLKDKITVRDTATYLPDESELDLTAPEYTGFASGARTRLANVLEKVKSFLPTQFEEIETNLTVSERKPAKEGEVETPFTNYGKREPFNAIQHPERYDQHMIGGKTQYADTTRIFQEHIKQSNMYESELDRISIAAESIAHQGYSNMYGVIRDLVEAGMRVPIAALPHSYILHLCGRVRDSAETGEMAFNSTDLKLIRHWKQMSDMGLDPIYGSKELAGKTQIFKTEAIAHFNGYIKPFFDRLEADRTAKAAKDKPEAHIS